MCVVPAVASSQVIEEVAYPNSILDDPATREKFLSIHTEEVPAVVETARLGFWRRQFTGTATSKQTKFDWLFSVILPVICFAFDPIVFRSEGDLLYRFAPVAVPLSYTAIMGTMLWLLIGKRLGRLNTWLSGIFAICAVVSLAIGVVLFPFSAVGMFIIIGFLGYTPLLMSFSLFRNAVRSYRAAGTSA